jgi:hypothetical protein
MANIKFYRKGNYIIIEDSADSKYYEEHAEKVYVKKATLAATDYYITIGDKRWLAQPIAEIQDEAGSVYAAADFEKLYQESTGGLPESVSSSSSKSVVAASNTSQELIAANPARKGVWVSNLTADSAFIGFSATAVEDSDSLVPTVSSVYIASTEQLTVISPIGATGNIVAREIL